MDALRNSADDEPTSWDGYDEDHYADPYRGDDRARNGDAKADQLEDDARIERADRRENGHEKNRTET